MMIELVSFLCLDVCLNCHSQTHFYNSSFYPNFCLHVQRIICESNMYIAKFLAVLFVYLIVNFCLSDRFLPVCSYTLAIISVLWTVCPSLQSLKSQKRNLGYGYGGGVVTYHKNIIFYIINIGYCIDLFIT